MTFRHLLTSLTVALSFAANTHAADKPVNLLILYADDLGWGELGCQGSQDIPTPNIDSIAKNGLRCTQGYVAATYCSPSRAGLMTGKDSRKNNLSKFLLPDLSIYQMVSGCKMHRQSNGFEGSTWY